MVGQLSLGNFCAVFRCDAWQELLQLLDRLPEVRQWRGTDRPLERPWCELVATPHLLHPSQVRARDVRATFAMRCASFAVDLRGLPL